MLKTPILLVTFNRPDHVRRVLPEILKQEPHSLYVCQDGARDGNESDRIKCQEVRDVVKELTEPYAIEHKAFALHTLYHEHNLGCGRGPYEAMSWFFRKVEKGIILEDDIFPHPLFWPYMEDLLERYKDDERIGMVTAHNLYRKYSRHHSYYFTHDMAGTLGWGTWRRVWEKFDFDIQFDHDAYDKVLKKRHIPYLCRQRTCAYYAKWLSGDRHDCWDYQFDYFLLLNNYLNIRANSCLTSHEGDGEDATHSGYTNPGYKMEVNTALFERIDHPTKVDVEWLEKVGPYKKELRLVAKRMIRIFKAANN